MLRISLLSISIILTVLSCRRDDNIPSTEFGFPPTEAIENARVVCGKKKMEWLSELISKAEEDKNKKLHGGNYIGSIFTTEHKGKTIFVVDMAMGSGGLAYRMFDCEGKQVKFSNPEYLGDPHKNDRMIYSTFRP